MHTKLKNGWSTKVGLLFLVGFPCPLFFIPPFYLEVLRVGTLNINGGCRDKRGVIVELSITKNIDGLFLQETHSSVDKEVEWLGEDNCF